MRLYRGKVEVIAEDTIRALREAGMIELENEPEARIDIEAVLRVPAPGPRDRGRRQESHGVRGLGYSQLGKVKSQVSKERGAPGQDEVLPYLLDQIMNILFPARTWRRSSPRTSSCERRDADPAQAHGSRFGSRSRSALEDQEPPGRQHRLRRRYARVMEQIKHKRGLT